MDTTDETRDRDLRIGRAIGWANPLMPLMDAADVEPIPFPETAAEPKELQGQIKSIKSLIQSLLGEGTSVDVIDPASMDPAELLKLLRGQYKPTPSLEDEAQLRQHTIQSGVEALRTMRAAVISLKGDAPSATTEIVFTLDVMTSAIQKSLRAFEVPDVQLGLFAGVFFASAYPELSQFILDTAGPETANVIAMALKAAMDISGQTLTRFWAEDGQPEVAAACQCDLCTAARAAQGTTPTDS